MSDEIVVKVKVEVDQTELDELKSVVKQHLEADAIRRKVIAKAAQEALDALDKIDYEVPVTRIENLIRSREFTAEEAASIKAAVDARVRKPKKHAVSLIDQMTIQGKVLSILRLTWKCTVCNASLFYSCDKNSATDIEVGFSASYRFAEEECPGKPA